MDFETAFDALKNSKTQIEDIEGTTLIRVSKGVAKYLKEQGKTQDKAIRDLIDFKVSTVHNCLLSYGAEIKRLSERIDKLLSFVESRSG